VLCGHVIRLWKARACPCAAVVLYGHVIRLWKARACPCAFCVSLLLLHQVRKCSPLGLTRTGSDRCVGNGAGIGAMPSAMEVLLSLAASCLRPVPVPPEEDTGEPAGSLTSLQAEGKRLKASWAATRRGSSEWFRAECGGIIEAYRQAVEDAGGEPGKDTAKAVERAMGVKHHEFLEYKRIALFPHVRVRPENFCGQQVMSLMLPACRGRLPPRPGT
jgi:hypothetical protein